MNMNEELSIYDHVSQANALFGMHLVEAASEHPELRIVTADMAVAGSIERFKLTYPDQFVDVGIAEQNLVGVAAGMASAGYRTIAVAQGCFISMRAFEMNRQYLGYMKYPVVLVGLNSGFFLQYFGNTHYALEDLAIMRTIPNIQVFSPCDAYEAIRCMEFALQSDKPSYVRLTGGATLPLVHPDGYDFEAGKADVLRQGKDVSIYATGAMTYRSMEAAKLLAEQGYDAEVVNIHTIKPFDNTHVKEQHSKRLIVTVEEHSVIGGLGGAVADAMSEIGKMPPLLKLGVKDCFSKPGSYEYLMEQHRLTPELIAEDILNKLKAL